MKLADHCATMGSGLTSEPLSVAYNEALQCEAQKVFM